MECDGVLGCPTGDYRIIPSVEAVDKTGVGLIRAGGESETVVDGGVFGVDRGEEAVLVRLPDGEDVAVGVATLALDVLCGAVSLEFDEVPGGALMVCEGQSVT